MPPGWTQALRFAAGERVRFTRSLAPSLRAALAKTGAPAAAWLTAVDGAIVAIDTLEPARCSLSARAPAGRASVDARLTSNATYDVRATVEHGAGADARTFDGVVIMLGGTTDAYVARRSAAGTQQLLRLRYDAKSTYAEVAVFTAPFAARLTPAVRALMPSVVVIGRLELAREDGGGAAP